MQQAIKLINTSKGNITIDFLASNTCLSRKQFERIFQAHIGISPKQYLKIVRFQNAIFIKQNSKAITLTDLAYESGYYDQSHFIKEIKDLAGKTPKNYLKVKKLYQTYFIKKHPFILLPFDIKSVNL